MTAIDALYEAARAAAAFLEAAPPGGPAEYHASSLRGAMKQVEEDRARTRSTIQRNPAGRLVREF
jgi:hypothetical protein